MLQIAVEAFKSEVLDLLEETFERSHGIFLDRNTSLFETLDTITAEEASKPVSSSCASIAAQVTHTTFYLDVLMKFIETGADVRVDWGEIWRTVEAVTPEEWDATKTDLRTAYDKLRGIVQNYEGFSHPDAIGGAMGMIAHSAYHLGEIRQALCTVRQG
jgi:hypothetical protein